MLRTSSRGKPTHSSRRLPQFAQQSSRIGSVTSDSSAAPTTPAIADIRGSCHAQQAWRPEPVMLFGAVPARRPAAPATRSDARTDSNNSGAREQSEVVHRDGLNKRNASSSSGEVDGVVVFIQVGEAIMRFGTSLLRTAVRRCPHSLTRLSTMTFTQASVGLSKPTGRFFPGPM